MKTKTLVLAAGFLAAFSVAGCQRTAEGVSEDAQRNTEKVAEETREAGKEVGDATRDAGREVKEETREAGRAVGQATEGAAEATQDAAQVAILTPKVKNALYADQKISGYKLNVDTLADQKVVRITGTAPTAAEKNRITQVAQKALEGSSFKVQNNVTVGS
uniref:BON domain-containing protein n=1 Tax=uncultured Armatimonadetes bacterium TaxID=157466 RepID=A0A6J4K5Y5_9BACT|nr:hypothetical protein AVDCRST_MAG63-4837 [uncultured Armatimonadetes bacterium]